MSGTGTGTGMGTGMGMGTGTGTGMGTGMGTKLDSNLRSGVIKDFPLNLSSSAVQGYNMETSSRLARSSRFGFKALSALAVLLSSCSHDTSQQPRLQGVSEPWFAATPIAVVDGPNLPSSEVQNLFLDAANVLWISTRDGLTRYDIGHNAWRHFSASDGLLGQQVDTPVQDATGALWVGTDSGLFRYEAKSDAFTSLASKLKSLGDSIYPLASGKDGILWFGSNSGVSWYNPASDAFKSFSESDGLSTGTVYAIHIDAKQAVWVASYRGLSRFDPGSKTWKSIALAEGFQESSVTDLLADPAGSLWVSGTVRDKDNPSRTTVCVGRYDDTKASWSMLDQQGAVYEQNAGFSMAQDEKGLWLGTRKGLVRVDLESKVWKTWTTEDGLANNEVTALQRDGNGNLWIGTRDGLNRYDKKTGSLEIIGKADHLIPWEVQSMVEDTQGLLWFVTRTGLRAINKADGSWLHFDSKDLAAFGPKPMVHQDREKTLWIASQKGLVGRYVLDKHGWETFSVVEGLGPDDLVRGIHRDASGIFWASMRQRLVRYDPKTNERGGLEAEVAASVIYRDSTGKIWLGEEWQEEVVRVDPDKNVWQSFSAKQGFATQGPAVIAEATDGMLWFGTRRGVFYVDPKDPSDKPFKKLEGADKNTISIVEDRGAALWFGSYGGVTRFHPRERTGAQSFKMPQFAKGPLVADREGGLWWDVGGRAVRLVLGGGDSDDGGTSVTLPMDPQFRIMATDGLLLLSRPGGLSVVATPDPNERSGEGEGESQGKGIARILPDYPNGAEVSVVAKGPAGRVWVGTQFSGLLLRDLQADTTKAKDLQLTKVARLPSMTVTALATVPGSDGSQVWVGTTAGAALVSLREGKLNVDHVLPLKGPVDAVFVAQDASLFIAQNKVDPKVYMNDEYMKQRPRTLVYRILQAGAAMGIEADKAFEDSDVYALAYSPKHGLWAATSAGLYQASVNADELAGVSRFQPVKAQGSVLQQPIRRLAMAPDEWDTLWMAVDRKESNPTQIVGFRPQTGWLNTTLEVGIPLGDTVDDLVVSDNGDIWVLSGSKVSRGRVGVKADGFGPRWWMMAGLLGIFAVGGGIFWRLQGRRWQSRSRGQAGQAGKA